MRLGVTALCVLLLLSCQARAASPPGPTVVWGEVPKQCACHLQREPLARVAADFQDARLPVDFRVENTEGGWELFSVTFDPTAVSLEHITQIMKNAGARVIAAPVASGAGQ